MKYTKSVLAKPFPFGFHDIGEHPIIEWKSPEDNDLVNVPFLQQLNSKWKKGDRIFTTLTKSFFEKNTPLNPSLFIFHMSRCGSTYTANYFATDSSNRVYNEPRLLVHFFSNHNEFNEQNNYKLKQAIQLLGCGAQASQNKLVIKLTSSNIHQIDWFQKNYPKTPKIFIHREPEEVIVSLFESAPVYLAKYNYDEEVLLQKCIQNLEEILELVLKNREQFHSFIAYKNLTAELKLFENKLCWKEKDSSRPSKLEMIEKQYSKLSTRRFEEDCEVKQSKWREIKQKYHPSMLQLNKLYDEIRKL